LKSNAAEDELIRYRNVIRRNFPGFPVRAARKLGEGRRSVAILVDEQWVFRFPKAQDGADDLEKEIRILPKLAERITVAIPKFEFVGKQENGMPFVGYRRLPGELLEEDAVPSLPPAERLALAGQIASFIDELSSFPPADAKALGVPERDVRKDFAAMLERAERMLYPLLDPKLQAYITSRFESYFGNSNHFRYTPALLHADLSPDHFLIDPRERKLTGIIDFGDLQIADPDYEYVYLLEDCGEPFARRVMEARGQEDIEERLNKVSFFVTAGHLATMIEGIHRGNREWFEEGIEAIREEME